MGVKWEGLLYFAAAIVVNFGAFLLHLLKVFFNLSFIATGFRLVYPKVVGIEDIKAVFAHALDNLVAINVNLSGLKKVFVAFSSAYEQIDGAWDQVDLSYRWRAENTCGGAVKWLQYFAILIAFGFFFYMTVSDALYILIIQSHKIEKGKSKIVALILKALIKAATTIVFYLLQVAAFVGLQMAFDGQSRDTSGDPICSESDRKTNLAARWFTLITLIILAVPAALIFGGGGRAWRRIKVENAIGKLIAMAFIMTKHIVLLTLGIWDAENLDTYEIKEKAAKYDDDPTDKDSKQEDVIEIVSKTRGLFWILFPGTIILTKVTEALNTPVIFSKQIEYKDGKAKRIILWILGVLELAVTIALIFVPGLLETVLLFLSVLFQFFVKLFVDCGVAIKIFLNKADKGGIV